MQRCWYACSLVCPHIQSAPKTAFKKIISLNHRKPSTQLIHAIGWIRAGTSVGLLPPWKKKQCPIPLIVSVSCGCPVNSFNKNSILSGLVWFGFAFLSYSVAQAGLELETVFLQKILPVGKDWIVQSGRGEVKVYMHMWSASHSRSKYKLCQGQEAHRNSCLVNGEPHC